MDHPPSKKPKPQGSPLYWAGIISGFGLGVLLTPILHRRFPAADLTDTFRVAGFVFLVVGGILANRIPSRKGPDASLSGNPE